MRSDEGETPRLTKRVVAGLNISRRRAEELIRVQGALVNGVLIHEPQYRVPPTARVEVDGRVLRPPIFELRVLLYHKPVGQLCSASDGEGERSVFSHLPPPRHGRWIMVGRLDINSSGLLLFTTDGELAYRLMHPKYELDREYAVRVRGIVKAEIIKKLKEGVNLSDGRASFDDIVPHKKKSEGANQWFYVVVRSGRYRMIRRLWQSQGIQVSGLVRVRYANIALPPNMKKGECLILDKKTVSDLMKCVGY